MGRTQLKFPRIWAQYPPGSHSINYEVNAVIYSVPLAKELERDSARDLAYCTEFEPAAYQKRRTMVQFRDSVAPSSLPCCEPWTWHERIDPWARRARAQLPDVEAIAPTCRPLRDHERIAVDSSPLTAVSIAMEQMMLSPRLSPTPRDRVQQAATWRDIMRGPVRG